MFSAVYSSVLHSDLAYEDGRGVRLDITGSEPHNVVVGTVSAGARFAKRDHSRLLDALNIEQARAIEMRPCAIGACCMLRCVWQCAAVCVQAISREMLRLDYCVCRC